jgi:hypothetical protein
MNQAHGSLCPVVSRRRRNEAGLYARRRLRPLEPDGKEVFYLNGDALLAVPVSLEGSFSAGAAVELFRNPAFQNSYISYQYEVTPDGKRFLLGEEDDSGKTPSAAIHVVQIWTALLRKKAPAPAPE